MTDKTRKRRRKLPDPRTITDNEKSLAVNLPLRESQTRFGLGTGGSSGLSNGFRLH